MKKKLMTILITSIVMLAGMGIFVWKMSDISNGLTKSVIHNTILLSVFVP